MSQRFASPLALLLRRTPGHRQSDDAPRAQAMAGLPSSHPILAMQRIIGNSAVQRLLQTPSPSLKRNQLPQRIQRDEYGYGDDLLSSGGLSGTTEYGDSSTGSGPNESYGYGMEDDPLLSGGTGASSDYGSSSGGQSSSDEGYGYGTPDDPLMAGGTGGTSEVGGSSTSSEGGGDEGYGYGFSDDPLAAGGFGSTEDW